MCSACIKNQLKIYLASQLLSFLLSPQTAKIIKEILDTKREDTKNEK